MRMYFKSTEPVTVLKKVSADYNVNGNQGTTYRLAVDYGDDIEKIKCASKEVWESIPLNEPIVIVVGIHISGGSSGEARVCDYTSFSG